jgi:membrane protease YdiL (CAAX protease family)
LIPIGVLPWLLGAGAATMAGWLCLWAFVCGASAGGHGMPQLHITPEELYSKNPLYTLAHGTFDAHSLAIVIHMSLLVGFAEELLGRGLLQNALHQRYAGSLGQGWFSIRRSTLLAAVLFAFWHTRYLDLGPIALLPVKTILTSLLSSMTIVLVPSLLLCVVYERTRSLLAVVVLHDVIDGGKLVAWFLWTLVFPG